jgi:hypothetical protein
MFGMGMPLEAEEPDGGGLDFCFNLDALLADKRSGATSLMG